MNFSYQNNIQDMTANNNWQTTTLIDLGNYQSGTLSVDIWVMMKNTENISIVIVKTGSARSPSVLSTTRNIQALTMGYSGCQGHTRKRKRGLGVWAIHISSLKYFPNTVSDGSVRRSQVVDCGAVPKLTSATTDMDVDIANNVEVDKMIDKQVQMEVVEERRSNSLGSP